MVARNPRIVIIGAGMAGLTAANRLVVGGAGAVPVKEQWELVVVEASHRIGGRIHTTEFGGNRVELGATWIHGIGGSPVHNIAERIGSLESDKPWERMEGFPEDTVVKAEGGLTVDTAVFQSISQLYKSLMDVAQAKACDSREAQVAREAFKLAARNDDGDLSIGAFVRQGLESYWAEQESHNNRSYYKADSSNGNSLWNRKLVEEGVFSIHENTERTYTSAGSLLDLDFEAEKEYREFPDEQITIAKGYSTVLKSLASVLPAGTIQFGKKVAKIQWTDGEEIWSETAPVRIHFEDGSVMDADHVIITVSLGVLKAGTGKSKPALFNPPLPSCKVNAISKLGFGVVNKLFLQVDSFEKGMVYPFLQLIFSKSSSLDKKSKIPWWMRKTVSLCPIYKTSNVLLAWFAGEEALELECLSDEEIIKGVSDTLVSFGVRDNDDGKENRDNYGINYTEKCISESEAKEKINGAFSGVLKSGWGFDPLFRGSYSYVAVGSGGQDIDTLAEPLPKRSSQSLIPPLQLLFAGEATHRTHYSTTHGAYFSGLREANRLLQHYGWTNLECL